MLLTVSLLVIVYIMVGVSYQYVATKIDDYRYPAPGVFTDVGGYKIHSYCTGSGKPTVLLDAGLGANLLWWKLVQDDVSQFARVCSFDRAGYGWSDAGKEPRTSKTIVQELHTLLHAMPNTHSPYILVGHSFGGATMRLYANTYPDEVFGLVLVDACHEKQFQSAATKSKPSLLRRCKKYILEGACAHYTGITRWRMPSSMQSFFSDLLSKDIQNTIIAKASAVKSLRARDSEWAHIHESLAQVAQSKNQLKNKPVLVITHGKQQDAAWTACQQELTNLSNHGKYIIAKNSGHMINVEQPEIIVQAVHDLVTKYHKT